jgi:hypothetical protein
MMNTSRPSIVTGAAVLLLLLSLFNLSTPFQSVAIKPPLPVIIWALVAGVFGLIAVVGLWTMQRWSWRLSVILSAVSVLVAVPGIFVAPDVVGKSVSVGLIVLYGLVLVLGVLPATRQAFAEVRTRVAA